MRLFDGTGTLVPLGREVARGGEGAILEVTHAPNFVAKIYHTSVGREKVAKLAAMARLAMPELLRVAAWPTSTLHDAPGGAVVGILMPRISAHREIHQLYSPAQRKLHFPKARWDFLAHVALNCAAAFETVHHCGHVVGDVNQSGVLVSERGTVHLIDCDSFQVRCNGEFFPCVVGVPEYTPPELQGHAFRGVERTKNHDAFGLALLIFHLLFMGRHPFAGRFHGAGDMPIERAIAEGRFAFGPLASSRQMTEPPHSLPLTALPDLLVTMFERAFALPSAGVTRPTSTEWREGMLGLRSNLTPCLNDRGHVYPGILARCPWCSIMQGGGPNFFISVQIIISGVSLELPAFDFTGVWHQIDAIPRPALQRPAYPAQPNRIAPRPLPPDVKEQRLILRLVRGVTVAAFVTALVGVAVSDLTKYIGFALVATFAIWWAVLSSSSKLARELAHRKSAAARLRASLQDSQRHWDSVAQEAVPRFDKLKAELRTVMAQAGQLPTQFEHERRELDAHRREEQLQQFLDTVFLRDHQIEKIGRGRRATLLSYGIETAGDLTSAALDQIPGFGKKTINSLLRWRGEIVSRFVFDTRKAPPTEKLQQLVIKYTQLQRRYEASLVQGERDLRGISESSGQELRRSAELIAQLVPQVRQADADAAVK